MNKILFSDIRNKIHVSNEIIDKIITISKYTKTGSREKPYLHVIVQPLLLHILCKFFECENFFEIGYGRGTSSMAVSLLDNVKFQLSLDIMPFDMKKDTFVNFLPISASNKDLFDMIPYDTKYKISYFDRKNEVFDLNKYKKQFNVLFIDGNHKIDKIVAEDFNICEQLATDENIIIFDDYGPDWAVTRVIDKLIENRKDLDFLLINTMSNYPTWGHVIVTKKNHKKMNEFLSLFFI
jgi:hypothetical protein